jgi:hypothetical protein
VVGGTGHDESVDWWALGVLVYHLITGDWWVDGWEGGACRAEGVDRWAGEGVDDGLQLDNR